MNITAYRLVDYGIQISYKIKKSAVPLLSSWYDFGLWSAKKYRSWIHYSGPSPTFLVAVQGDWLCRGSQPRHWETASRLTNAKGAGSPANWQAGGCQEPCASLQTFRTSGPLLKLNTKRQQRGASQHTDVSGQLSFWASVRAGSGHNLSELCHPLSQIFTKTPKKFLLYRAWK